MAEKSSKPRKKTQNSIFQNQTFVIALIGVIGTIAAAIISVSPQLIQLARQPSATPTPTITATVTATSLPTLTPTEARATGTATQIPPTPTESLTPTPTPITPPLSCLNRWEVISDLSPTPESQAGCEKFRYPDLGIEPLQNGSLSFGKTGLQIDTLTGITTKLTNKANQISFEVELNELTDSEFWVALSNDKNPESDSISFRLQSNGLVRIYNVNGAFYTNKTWNELGTGSPYNYKFVFKINGTSVDFFINELPLNLSVNPNYLFFGFKQKSTVKPVTVFVTISNLEVK